MATFLRRAAPLAALFLLNASLTFYDDWPTPNVQWYGHLSAELAAAVLLLALIVRRAAGEARRGRRGRCARCRRSGWRWSSAATST